MFIFIRIMPAISIFEMRMLLPEAEVKSKMSHAQLSPAIYGIAGGIRNATDLVNAAKAAYAAGYRKMDAYSPFPIEEASEAIGFHKSRVPLIVLLGGILGRAFGICPAVLDQRDRLSVEHWRQAL